MTPEDKISMLVSDFFAHDDIDTLVKDTGKILNCPLMVIDDTFHIVSHYSPDGFSDNVFDSAISLGEITYEVGALISESDDLRNGIADYVDLEESPYVRRFAPLISDGIRLGYLICVDINGNLNSVSTKIYHQIESVLAKQLFVEAGRTDLPFETTEEILSHLLDGGFQSQSYFRLQISSTYLADFHPTAFAVIDLVAYHSQYIGKSFLKDELTYRFYESHPFLHKGKVFMFLHEGYDRQSFVDLAKEFHLKIVISNQIDNLYNIPAMYNLVLEALEILVNGNIERVNVVSISQLTIPIILNKMQEYENLISPEILSLANYDRKKGSQFCETLYYYLINEHSLKGTCEALYTHRNTILYRIQKIREDFNIPLENPSSNFKLLTEISIILYKSKGPEFFL